MKTPRTIRLRVSMAAPIARDPFVQRIVDQVDALRTERGWPVVPRDRIIVERVMVLPR